MPIPKNYPLRKGDIVSVRGVVKFASEDTIAVEVGYSTVYPVHADLDLVEAKFEVGEWVEVKGSNRPVEVVALKGNLVWISDGSRDELVKSNELLRAPHRVQAEPDHWTVGPVEVAEGTTRQNADGTLETTIGEFKPVEGPDPLKAVLENLNKEPNVNPAFKR